jgi:LexA-binding, inner membrane-associated putative hydrolase
LQIPSASDRCDIIAAMPSPVGHALGGIAAGCAIFPARARGKLVWFAVAGLVADFDLFLPLTHRGPTHSVAAAALVFACALVVLVPRDRRGIAVRLAAAVAAAYLTHVLLDWLGEDSGPPSGIMALWPFTHHYYVSGLDLFARVERRYWLPGFWRDNVTSVLREIVILAPVAWFVCMLSWRRARAAGDQPWR